MASGIFYPVVDHDDGMFRVGGFFRDYDYMHLGEAQSYNFFIRFLNVNIPQGATITEAYIKLTAYGTYLGTECNANIYFNDIDDAVAPNNEAEAFGLDLTGAVAWDNIAPWDDVSQHNTPELKTILQAVINRVGWSGVNAIQVVVKNNASDLGANRHISSVERTGGLYKAELHVTWESGDTSGIFSPAVNGDDGVRQGATSLFLTWVNGTLGVSGNTNNKIFTRFPNVTIAKNSIIKTAYIKFKSRSDWIINTCNEDFWFNKSDNAVAPTTFGEFDALVKTVATVAWDAIGAWAEDAQYDSPDISALLQEIVDRGGWGSGNAVMLIGDGVRSVDWNAYRSFSAFANGSGYPELIVTWTEPTVIDADVTNPSMSAQGFTGIDARDVTNPSMSAESFTGITAEPSIAMIRGQATLSDNIIHIESFATIPSMSASLIQAEQIWGAATIPSMMAEITERGTTLADVSIPMMTAELASGIHADLEVAVPAMTAEGLFSNQCEITVPMMTIEMEGQVGRVISSAVSIPKMTVEITGKTEHLVDGAVSVPMVRVRADFVTGKIITGTIILPAMEAALTSHEDIDGDINVSISAMVAFLEGTTERSACPVLRYDDKPDILGSMAAEIPMAEASLTEL